MSAAAAPERLLPVALAFVAGFVDTCGFVALLGLFSAHVTGNFVLLGASLIQPHAGVLAKLLALPIFVAAVAGTRLFLNKFGVTRAAVDGVLAAELAFLGLFLAAGVAATPVRDADAPLAVLAGLLAVVAMGVQNAASRTVLAAHSPTTVMTGNVTQVVIDCVDYLSATSATDRTATRARIAKFAPPILAFTVGAAGGALGYGLAGFWCVSVPMVALGALLARRPTGAD